MRNFRILLALVVLGTTIGSYGVGAAGQAPQDNPESPEIVLGLRQLYEGFESPTHIANAGDGSGRLFVVERGGVVRVIDEGEVQPGPFLDLSDIVLGGGGELGMFSIAFHPDYAQNGYFFVYYTARPDGANTIARYRVSEDDPNRADPDSALVVLAIGDENDTHNGGGLAFGPDGYLYIGTGDGGGFADPNKNAQDLGALLGKILRIDPSTATTPAGQPYAVPPDNPFVAHPGARPEIWAYGLRNPFRLSFDPVTGDLFIGDVGDGAWEEVDIQPGDSPGGQNYGWPITEGLACFPAGGYPCDTTGITLPDLVYSHDFGCSITGGLVYRGGESPVAGGRYVYGDWCSGWIWLAEKSRDGDWGSTELLESKLQITSFGAGESGELYMADMTGGAVYRMVFYRQDPALRIDYIDPDHANATGHGFTLRVHGSGFTEDAVIQWNGIERQTTFVSENELEAEISAADLGVIRASEPQETVQVTVAVPGQDPRISNPVAFSLLVFGDERFYDTWRRTDGPVAALEVSRTWMWGPAPISTPLTEPYADAPNGERLVQYFDKSRMEITNPNEPDPVWEVTNGLLVIEMITGRMQSGAAIWEPAGHPLGAAEISVAGDTDDPTGPTYLTFAGLMDPVDDRTGQLVIERLNRDGETRVDGALAARDIEYAFYDDVTGHNIPEPFWEFMTSSGPVSNGTELAIEPLFLNPFYATGRPVTEAYWSTVKIANESVLVLVQCFERRCLTYREDGSPGWQVQTGNVGRHYYEWRYGAVEE